MKEFRMPSLGADMEAGTLIEWLKRPGDTLQRGDIVAIVETQKGAIEIEVFDNGILEATLVEPGAEVPVGHVLAMIRSPDEPSGGIVAARSGPAPTEAPLSRAPRPTSPAHTPLVTAATSAAPAIAARGERPKVTPLAQRLAAERKIDLSRIAVGADGIVGLREIEGAASGPAPLRRAGRLDVGEMRKAIAAAMARANRDIPHYYVSATIDVSPLVAWLAEYNRTRPVDARLLYVAPLVKGVAVALKRFEALNGYFENGVFSPSTAVNVGIAVAMRRGGLVTPAILGVDGLDLGSLMARLNDVVGRVRGGGLRSSELSMGTVTLTNLGERTADAILPIIYPPQVAIIGCGQIRERAWVAEGRVVARPLLEVTVAGDHRVSDGRTGAQFLRRLEELLSKPEDL
jgi:pyruvate dehydrogenase E2 component (dihydrolipoamide acetyltransferase)